MPHLHSQFFMQVVVNSEPRPVSLPQPEVMIDRLPMRQVVRERAPRAAAPDEVLDGVDDLAQGVAAVSTARLLYRQQRL